MHVYANGIPRVINLLCDHALIAAFAKSVKPVPASVVEETAREYDLYRAGPTAPPAPSDNREEPHPDESLHELAILMDRLRRPE